MRRWIRRRLLAWYDKHGRDFAWRHTTDPYQVLMAEMMVQRTRAEQAEKVWKEWVAAYPTIEDAAAEDAEVLRSKLTPLGLTWRADNMIDLVKLDPPLRRRRSLAALPGVSHYVSAATASIAFATNDAVVDSNVVRIYSRLFGLVVNDSTRRNHGFHLLAQALAGNGPSARFNWSLLDLGAEVCRPRRPLCQNCPLYERCNYADTASSSSSVVSAS